MTRIMARARLGIFITIASVLLAGVSCGNDEEVVAVRLSESSLSLVVGETATLDAIVVPPVADYDGVTWSSSDPSVATVENGVIHVHKAGTANITATVGGVVSRACAITVDLPVIVPVETVESVETVELVETEEQPAETVETVEPAVEAEPEEVIPETTEPVAVDEAPVVPEETIPEVTQEPSKYSFIYDVDFGEKGSFIDLDSLVTVTDWRGYNFNEHPSYWNYYGPFEFTVDLKNAECDMNGERQALPQSVTLIQTAAGATSVADPTTGSSTTLPANRHGFLMVKFSTVGLTEPFKIFVKIKVKYGFGTIQTDWIKIPVIKAHPAD